MIFFLLLSFLTQQEEKLIKDMLSYKYLRIEDLSFEKDKSIFTNLKDSLTLEFLKYPIKIPEYAENIYKNFEGNEKEIIENFFKFKIKEKSFYEALKNSLRELKRAKNLIKNSLSEIEKGKLDTLIYNLTVLFTDENDEKDDTLYAVFEKEGFKPFELPKKWDEKKISKYLLKINTKELFKGLKIAFYNLLNITYSLLREENLRDTIFKTDFGYVVINTKDENNIYKGDSFFIIFDLKGDDRYIGRTGTANLFYLIPFSIVIDKGGNDLYISDKILSICSSFFGVSIQYDLKGNDLRRGKMNSISSSMFGISFLFDKEGDDIYESDFFSQCASFFGKSFLFDFKGNDLYKITESGQSFSSTKGFSILFDREGNDSYIAYGKHYHIPLLPDETRSFAQAFSIGIRPYLGGGVAILIDKEGNDVYYSEVYGQGCGYFYGSGILIEGKGNDLYHLAEYGQGAGIHFAAGGLFDLEGDDDYISRFGPAQGEGHDYAVGVLIDKKGHDTYKVSGGQGIGLNTSVGIFIDSEGNDLYVTTEEYGQGSGKMSRGKIGIGIFIDIKGKDFYKGEDFKNEPFIWSKGEIGFGYDLDTIQVIEPEEEGIEIEIPEDLVIDSLFKIASKWEVGKYKKKVPKAREILAKRGKKALDYIFKNKINTLSGLELRAIKEVIKENKKHAVDYLKKALEGDNDTIKINALYLLGEGEIKDLEEDLLELLEKDKRDFIRARTIYALGKIKTEKFEKLFKYLNSESIDVKISLIRAGGEIKKRVFLLKLIDYLKEGNSLVRFGAEKVLREEADSVKKEIIEKIKREEDELFIFHSLRVLQGIKKSSPEVKGVLIEYSQNKNEKIRAEAVRGLLKFRDDKGIENILHTIKSTEKDPYILWIFKEYGFK